MLTTLSTPRSLRGPADPRRDRGERTLVDPRYSEYAEAGPAGNDVGVGLSATLREKIAEDVPVAPWHVGSRSFPAGSYETVARQAVRSEKGHTMFAGPRDEPFFVDLHVFDLLGVGGAPTTDGVNVMSLVLEVPIEEVAYARFDFDTISRLVLARNWRKLDAKQQEDFTREFKKHLTVTYGDNINSYANETVDITGDREEPRGDWTVQTKIVRGSSSEDIFVDYRLRPREGEWKVIDVVVERISLVSNFRSQLQEIISREGADAMIAKLAAKNASGESLFPEEEARSRR